MDLTIRQQLKDVVGDMVSLLEQGAANPNAPPVWKLKAQTSTTAAKILYEIIRQNLASGEAFYFGVVEGRAHRLFDANLLPVTGFPKTNVTEIPDIIAAGIDGGFLPDTDTEGITRVQIIEGWTVVSLPDRSADRRMGSHSTFVIAGVFAGSDGIAEALRLFPTLFERFTFQVVLEGG